MTCEIISPASNATVIRLNFELLSLQSQLRPSDSELRRRGVVSAAGEESGSDLRQ
jgi:hypothetical protein